MYPINVGIPRESLLGPVLYQLSSVKILNEENVTTVTFADDKAILAYHTCPIQASRLLQNVLSKFKQ